MGPGPLYLFFYRGDKSLTSIRPAHYHMWNAQVLLRLGTSPRGRKMNNAGQVPNIINKFIKDFSLDQEF